MSFALSDVRKTAQTDSGGSPPIHRTPVGTDHAAILIVDPNRQDRLLLERELRLAEGAGIAVRQAGGFAEALDLLRTERFRAGLINLQLGAESGLELVRCAGGRKCPTPLILLTGAGTRANDVAALAAGVIDCLEKQHLSATALARTIRYACHTHALEARLHDTMQCLEKASRAKSDFLARMSHDFRTPLNAILGFSELIRDQHMGATGDNAYAEYAGDIHASGSHLLDLVNDLLDLAKIEAGQFRLDLVRVDIADAIADVLRITRPQAARKGVRIEVGPMAHLPRLRADPRGLKQMLLNLLSNAVKFTETGGAIAITAANDGGDYRLAVADTGIGIASHDIDRVLAPFGQAHRPTAQGETGTGLGLPIVKSLVELHGGRFELHSMPGTGTTATLCFPV